MSLLFYSLYVLSNLYPTIEEVRLMMEKTAINQMNRAHAQARQIFRLKEVWYKSMLLESVFFMLSCLIQFSAVVIFLNCQLTEGIRRGTLNWWDSARRLMRRSFVEVANLESTSPRADSSVTRMESLVLFLLSEVYIYHCSLVTEIHFGVSSVMIVLVSD